MMKAMMSLMASKKLMKLSKQRQKLHTGMQEAAAILLALPVITRKPPTTINYYLKNIMSFLSSKGNMQDGVKETPRNLRQKVSVLFARMMQVNSFIASKSKYNHILNYVTYHYSSHYCGETRCLKVFHEACLGFPVPQTATEGWSCLRHFCDLCGEQNITFACLYCPFSFCDSCKFRVALQLNKPKYIPLNFKQTIFAISGDPDSNENVAVIICHDCMEPLKRFHAEDGNKFNTGQVTSFLDHPGGESLTAASFAGAPLVSNQGRLTPRVATASNGYIDLSVKRSKADGFTSPSAASESSMREEVSKQSPPPVVPVAAPKAPVPKPSVRRPSVPSLSAVQMEEILRTVDIVPVQGDADVTFHLYTKGGDDYLGKFASEQEALVFAQSSQVKPMPAFLTTTAAASTDNTPPNKRRKVLKNTPAQEDDIPGVFIDDEEGVVLDASWDVVLKDISLEGAKALTQTFKKRKNIPNEAVVSRASYFP